MENFETFTFADSMNDLLNHSPHKLQIVTYFKILENEKIITPKPELTKSDILISILYSIGFLVPWSDKGLNVKYTKNIHTFIAYMYGVIISDDVIIKSIKFETKKLSPVVTSQIIYQNLLMSISDVMIDEVHSMIHTLLCYVYTIFYFYFKNKNAFLKIIEDIEISNKVPYVSKLDAEMWVNHGKQRDLETIIGGLPKVDKTDYMKRLFGYINIISSYYKVNTPNFENIYNSVVKQSTEYDTLIYPFYHSVKTNSNYLVPFILLSPNNFLYIVRKMFLYGKSRRIKTENREFFIK